jgi:periplasmic protein TonB
MAMHAVLIGLLLWPRPRSAVEVDRQGSSPGPAIIRIYGSTKPSGRPDAISRQPVKAGHPKPARVNLVESKAAAPSTEAVEEEPPAGSAVDEGAPQELSDLGEPAGGGGGDGIGGTSTGLQGAGSSPQGPVAYSAEMTPPRVISGPDPRYTAQAQEHEIEGTMLVRCIVGVDGSVRDCRVTRGLPFMDREVIQAVQRRRYSPALLAGHPVEVDYTFKIELRLP